MSMELARELKKLLISRLGFSERDWELGMAVAVGLAVNEVGDPEQVAEKIVEEFIASLPPDMAALGKERLHLYFSRFGYESNKRRLMAAAKKVTGS